MKDRPEEFRILSRDGKVHRFLFPDTPPPWSVCLSGATVYPRTEVIVSYSHRAEPSQWRAELRRPRIEVVVYDESPKRATWFLAELVAKYGITLEDCQ